MKLKIVELNEERAKELSETYEEAEIINGNGIDTDLLEEENFSSYDACVSLTGIDEENITKIMECGAAGGCMMSGFMK